MCIYIYIYICICTTQQRGDSVLYIFICEGTLIAGACGDVVIKALRYKLAGRGFDSRWCHWNFSVI